MQVVPFEHYIHLTSKIHPVMDIIIILIIVPVTVCRFYCPLQNLENIPGGSFRLGGGRSCSQTKEAGFQMIISSDTRLLIGINVEDLYEKPYITPWLDVFREYYQTNEGAVDEQKKLNLARFFFADALAIRLNIHDTALTVKPSLFFPQPTNQQQIFSEGPSLLTTISYFAFFCPLHHTLLGLKSSF
jgi:hypothetical protein